MFFNVLSDASHGDRFAGFPLYEHSDWCHKGICGKHLFTDLFGVIAGVEKGPYESCVSLPSATDEEGFAQRRYKGWNELLCVPSHMHMQNVVHGVR